MLIRNLVAMTMILCLGYAKTFLLVAAGCSIAIVLGTDLHPVVSGTAGAVGAIALFFLVVLAMVIRDPSLLGEKYRRG